MKPASATPLWSADVQLPRRAPLSGNSACDAVVIGGGLCGVLTAWLLSQGGLDVRIVEAERTGGGATAHTTAKITSQHGPIYAKLTRDLGPEKAALYARANQLAIEQYAQLVQALSIDCDFERLPAFLYTRRDPSPLREELLAARRAGIRAELTEECPLPFQIQGALRFEDQAQFHPLKFLSPLAERLKIYEDTRALKAEGSVLTTDRGEIRAKYLIFTSHFPIVNFPGLYFARMHQARSYVLALEDTRAQLGGMYYDEAPGGFSLRAYRDLVLLGGGGHRTGKHLPLSGYEPLRMAAQFFYPGSREVFHWSNQDCMTIDSVPYIGPYAKDMPHWYVATGFQKWGMTHSMAAAQLISSKILDRACDWEALFSPQRRPTAAAVPNLGGNAAQAVSGLLVEKLKHPVKKLESLPKDAGALVTISGQVLGAYRDPGGALHLVRPQCPHMGCRLHWNPAEKTWDCPCHGSRFDVDGALLNNPAQTDLTSETKQFPLE